MDIKDTVKHEFIGKVIEIVDSVNKSNIGLLGKVINETRNTFSLDTSKGKKNLMKKNIKIKTIIKNKEVIIDGKSLTGHPKDRIKK